jgi:hypothetical protein
MLATACLAIGWMAWTWSNRDYQPHSEAATLFAEAQEAMAQSAPWRGTQLLERAVANDPQFLAARSLLAVGYSDVDRLDKGHESILEATAAADRRWRIGRGERLSLNAARAVVMRDLPAAAVAYRALANITQGTEHRGALLALARTSIQQGKPTTPFRLSTPSRPTVAVTMPGGFSWPGCSRARDRRRGPLPNSRLPKLRIPRRATWKDCATFCWRDPGHSRRTRRNGRARMPEECWN